MLTAVGFTANVDVIPETEIMPLWDNIPSLTNTFSFSCSTGTVVSHVYGDVGTTVTANVKVYRHQTAVGPWLVTILVSLIQDFLHLQLILMR